MRQFRSLPQRLGRTNLVAQPVHLEDELLREPARLISGHACERGSNEPFNDPGYPIGDASIIGDWPIPHFDSFNSGFWILLFAPSTSRRWRPFQPAPLAAARERRSGRGYVESGRFSRSATPIDRRRGRRQAKAVCRGASITPPLSQLHASAPIQHLRTCRTVSPPRACPMPRPRTDDRHAPRSLENPPTVRVRRRGCSVDRKLARSRERLTCVSVSGMVVSLERTTLNLTKNHQKCHPIPPDVYAQLRNKTEQKNPLSLTLQRVSGSHRNYSEHYLVPGTGLEPASQLRRRIFVTLLLSKPASRKRKRNRSCAGLCLHRRARA